jgi:hypothetical protein
MPMNAYLIYRILEEFDLHKMNRGPELCRSKKYTQPRNVIVYTGSSHSTFLWFALDMLSEKNAATVVRSNESKNGPDCVPWYLPEDFWKL